MAVIPKFIIKKKKFVAKCQGRSMLPLLQPDDIITYNKINFSRIKTNDIVMVKKNGLLFIHRVIYKRSVLSKNGPYLVTKGDNNLESDGKIYPRQIIAKVTGVKRNGRVFNPESLYLLQSTHYLQEVIKIKWALEKEQIDFVFLKGLPLHLFYEKTHPRRIYLDCDVLINKQDFNRVKDILLEAKYKPINSSLSNTHTKLRKKTIEQSLYKIINGLSIVFDVHLEINWMSPQLGKLEALYRQKLINKLTDEFLKTKKIVKINGEFFSILNTEYLILYLALHFFHHNFRGAFRLDLVDRIWRGPTLVRSDLIIEKIRKYQLQNYTYPVFILLKRLYKTPIPPQFLKSIQPSSSILNYLSSIINHPSSIFNEEPRITAGINRFKNLFYLSPQSLWRKLLVFINPQVLYSIAWVMFKKLKSLSSVNV